jgi:translation elongation factor EF-Ts
LCQHIIGTAVSPLRVDKTGFFDTDAYGREINFIKAKTYFEKKLVENVDVASKPYLQAQKILEARIAKWEEEATLLSQKFLFDPRITVVDYVKQLSDKLGFAVEISKFTKYSVST